MTRPVSRYNARPVNRTSRHDAFAVTILILITTFLFVDVLVGTHNFYLRDLTRYYYPMKQMVRDIVLGGEFPYWDRLISGGQPVAANPEHEVFYPLTWLLFLPNYFLGYRLHILVHIYIGLLGMYALLRSMALKPPASFVGAFSFGLGGLYMSYVNLLPILFCAAWIPLTCLYVRKFLIEPRLRWFALASLFFGLQCLVGEPTTVMQTGFILGMYALYRGWYAARDNDLPWRYALPEMASRVAFIGLISVAAFAVGAAQMLPAMDHVGDSIRSRGFDFKLVSAWSMPWAKFLELVYPNVLGHMAIDNVTWYWGGGLYPGMGSAFLFSIYGGLLVTALAAGALFARPRGGRFVLILAAFSFLLALGSHTPLLELLYDAGIASAVRYPEKFALIAIFAITVFSAKMLQRLIDGDEQLRRGVLGFVAATGIVAAVISLIGFTEYYDRAYRSMGLSSSLVTLVSDLSHRGWMIATVRSLVLFGIIWALPRVRRPLWVMMLATFVIADLTPVVHQLNPRLPARFFLEPPDLASKLPPDREDYRVFHEADWYGREKVAQRYFSTGRSVYWIVRAGLYPMTPAGNGFHTVMERDYDKTALLPTVDFVQSVWDVKASGRPDWREQFMAMSNAWFYSEYVDFEAEKKRVDGDMNAAEPIRFVPVEKSPRYYFADQIVSVRDKAEFVSRLSSHTYSPRVAFIGIPGFVPARGVVLGFKETANTAAIDVEADGKALLVMSVTPHKYWKITIDGEPATPIVTNIGYQGIIVPEGRHRVEMKYRNEVVPPAVTITLTASGFLLIAAVLPRRRRSRR